jgi:hypothetical protein
MIRRMVNTSLENATAMTMGGDLDTVGRNSIVDELCGHKSLCREMDRTAYLIVFGSQLIQAFLNNVISVQVLDEHNNMEAECNNDGMNLSIVSKISLRCSP